MDIDYRDAEVAQYCAPTKMATDSQIPDAAAFFSQHNARMVQHFANLFELDPDYARVAATSYGRARESLNKKIGLEVRAELERRGLIETERKAA